MGMEKIFLILVILNSHATIMYLKSSHLARKLVCNLKIFCSFVKLRSFSLVQRTDWNPWIIKTFLYLFIEAFKLADFEAYLIFLFFLEKYYA